MWVRCRHGKVLSVGHKIFLCKAGSASHILFSFESLMRSAYLCWVWDHISKSHVPWRRAMNSIVVALIAKYTNWMFWRQNIGTRETKKKCLRKLAIHRAGDSPSRNLPLRALIGIDSTCFFQFQDFFRMSASWKCCSNWKTFHFSSKHAFAWVSQDSLSLVAQIFGFLFADCETFTSELQWKYMDCGCELGNPDLLKNTHVYVHPSVFYLIWHFFFHFLGI